MPERLDATPQHGEVFLDTRGDDRALRLRWHHDADLVVLSLWRDGVCAGTFRLAKADVDDFVDALVDGLRDNSDPTDQSGNTAVPRQRPPTPSTTGNLGRHCAVRDVAGDDETPAFVEWAFGPPLDQQATAS